jgi:hypothetical protein
LSIDSPQPSPGRNDPWFKTPWGVGLITASATVLAAVIGLVGVQLSRSDTSPPSTTHLATTASPGTTGSTDNSGSARTTTDTTNTIAASCPASLHVAPTPQVRNCGPLVVGYLYAINLDSVSKNWDARSEWTDDADFWFDGGSIQAFASVEADFAPLPTGTRGSYERCATATGFGTSIDLTQLDPGAEICVRTSQRRISLLRLERRLRGSPTDNLALAAVTWEQ